MNKFNLKGVTSQTWVRTIVLVLALISQFLVIIGKKTESIDVNQWTEYGVYILNVVSAGWAWWKNNSFTKKAQEADDILHDDGENEILLEGEMEE